MSLAAFNDSTSENARLLAENSRLLAENARLLAENSEIKEMYEIQVNCIEGSEGRTYPWIDFISEDDDMDMRGHYGNWKVTDDGLTYARWLFDKIHVIIVDTPENKKDLSPVAAANVIKNQWWAKKWNDQKWTTQK